MRYYGAIIITILCAVLGAGCMSNSSSDMLTPSNDQEQSASGGEGTAATTLQVLTNRIDLIENGELRRYAQRFSEDHPGVEIEFEGITNYANDIMVRLSTRNMGDVLLLPNNITNQDLPNFFEPLDDTLFDHLRFADYKAYQGKRYGMTTGASTTGIVYNKAAFKKAGITVIPTTLDEFYEASSKLKNAGITPIYLNYGAQWPLMVWGEDLVSYMTGDAAYLNEMENTDEPWKLDTPWGEAMTIVRTLVDRGYTEANLIENNWEKSKSEIASGTTAMYLMGNWVINQIVAAGADSDNIGYFPFPYDNSKERYAPLSPDWFIGVSKFSTNKKLAAEWVEFFVRESGYVEDSGFMPIDLLKPSSVPQQQLQQFLSFNPILVERQPPSDRFLEIANISQIAFWSGDYLQEWIAAPDLSAVFERYNEKWKEARQSVDS